ncbi:hypothetical protein [Paraburkholderia bryophila]|uniref:hypothetical protein n=1 Tax=Paraburkholderia bryophila TaxID=420952 RepID=UPI00300E63E8
MDRRQFEDGRHHVPTGVVNLFEALFRARNRQFGKFDHLCGVWPGKPLAQHVGQRHQAIAVCTRLPPVQRPGNACRLPHCGLHAGQVRSACRTRGKQQPVAQRQVVLDGIEQQSLKRVLA